MGHTNSTPNFSLPQFLANDKPAWLTDINGAFSTIDTNMQSIKTTAQDNGTNITALTNRINTLEPIVAQHTTDITQLQTSNNINTDNISALQDIVSSIQYENFNFSPASGFTVNTAVFNFSNELKIISVTLSLISKNALTSGASVTLGTVNKATLNVPSTPCNMFNNNTGLDIASFNINNGSVRVFINENYSANSSIDIICPVMRATI